MIRKAFSTRTSMGARLLAVILFCVGFTMFGQAPTITTTVPTINASNTSVFSNIVLTFNVSINGATATTSTIKIKGTQSGRIAGTYSTVSNVVTFNPNNAFKPGEVVTVSITNQVIGTNIIAATPYGFQFTVQSQAGTGNFVGNEAIINGSANGAVDIKSADLDADGDLDVYGAARIGNSLQWFLNTGTGGFGALQQITINGIEAVDAADVNGDGLLDLLAAANVNQVLWYSNNGAGAFVSTPNVISSAETGIRDVHAVDVDNDGDMDVISAAGSGVSSVLRLFTNNGSGTFAGSLIQGNPGTDEPYSIFSADIDKDGDLDILTAGQTDDLISWYNNGSSWAKTVIGTTNGASSVYAADVDSDGDMDVLSAARNSDEIIWYSNSASGTSWSPAIIDAAANSASAVHAADVDGDGFMDVLSAYGGGGTHGVAWYKNNGSQVFAKTILTTAATGAYAVFAADLSSDGVLDILAAAETADQLLWYKQDVSSLFTDQTASKLVGVNAVSSGTTTFADYDNDNDLDLLIAGNNTFEMWRNNGSGTFTNVTSAAFTTPLGYSLDARLNAESAWGDFDGDGDLDLLYGGDEEFNTTSQRSWLLRNGGGGVFSDATPGGFPGLQDGTFNWVDFDNDGDLDISLHGFTGIVQTTQFWENNSGTFTNVTASLVPGVPGIWLGDIRWADFDNDGDQDFLLAGSNSGGTLLIEIWRNGTTGTIGTFSVFATYDSNQDGGGSIASAAWGDYDSDGDQDFIVSWFDATISKTQIYRNTAGAFADVTATVAPGLLQLTAGDLKWIDYDNDGDIDLMITGYDDFSSNFTQLWTNSAGVFTPDASALTGISGLSNTAVVWGDVDNDADLDFAITGFDGSNRSQLWINGSSSGNGTPAVPGGLSSSISGSDVTLTWSATTDLTTPAASITYNVYVGTTTQKEDVVPPNAAIPAGYRMIAGPGNAANGTTFSLYGLNPGTYYWSVQAIDNGFVGSAFASEGTFTITSGYSWVSAAGGANNDYGTDVAADASGNVFTVGHFTGNGDFDPSGGGVQNLISSGMNDVFVVKQLPDGTFSWARRIGGSGDEYASSVATDVSGNVFVAGHYTGTTDILTMSSTSAGLTDAFVFKLDGTGSLIWHKTFGGVNAESITAMTVDATGNVFIAGHFIQSINISGTNLTSNGEYDLFIAKFSNAGAFLWANRYGGTGSETVNELAVDASGNVYATGGFTGTTNFSGSSQTSNGLTDVYVAKLDPNGVIAWLNKAGGIGHDRGWGITVDIGGNVYATGEFTNTMGSLTSNGGYDVWVVKFNSGGGQTWSQKAGGAQNDMGFAIAVDGLGNVYVTGGFTGSNAPYGGSNLTPYGGYDGFIMKLDGSGNITQAARVGSGDNDYCRGAAIGSGSLLVTGYFHGFSATFEPASGTPVSGAGNAATFTISISN